MDVDFLSGMIKELILQHDTLSLPGLGTFVAEDMPASFSDRGYTINPPYRRLSFTGKETNDGLLAGLYAGSNSLERDEAEAIIVAFLKDLGETLRSEKSVDFPGLGRLRATRENHFFFVADEDLDISPDACGLGPVSLKSHDYVALPDIPAALAQRSAAAQNPAATPQPAAAQQPAPEPQPAAIQPAAQQPAAAQPAAPQHPARPRRRALGLALGAVGAAFALLLAFVLVSRLAPGSTDRLLYNQEELAIINYPEDGLSLPR